MECEEFKRRFEYKETVCSILSDKEEAIESAISTIVYHRKQLEKYIKANPKFLYSLQPISVSDGPEVVNRMAKAAIVANVGPMAAVAGVLADLAVQSMILNGAEMAVVENGGEVSVVSPRPIVIALSAGDSHLSKRVGFRLTSFSVGVATSSGLFSHALSFGEAEAVTVFASTAGLADAAATAVGNVVKGEDYGEAVHQGIRVGLSIKGVDGVFILYRDRVGKGGDIPQIISVNEPKIVI
jgi:ApbE superfamily uncharacterized protein (UPF0280 family)